MTKFKQSIKFSILYFLLLNTQLIACESAHDPTTIERSNDLVINRVDLPDDKKEQIFSIAHLNDTHENLSVKWLGKGSSVMIILAKNNKAKSNASRSTTMYISYDYGSTFVKEDKLKLKDGSPAILNTFITSKVNNSHFIFTDIVNNYLFISDDYGRTYETVNLTFSPKNVQMHSSLSNHILASDDSESTVLYLSKDFGRTWKNITDNVSKFSWASFEKPNRIYVLKNEKYSKSLVLSDDYFENKLPFLTNNVKDFKICGNYVVKTISNTNIGGSTKDQYLTMFVASNNSSFNMALFNNRSRLVAIDYIVADCTDFELIVAAKFNYSNNYDLLISDRRGNRLRKVLDNVVVSQTGNKSTVDIHKVAGLTGIYIANAYLYEGKSNSIISLITYDSGYSWKKINLTQVQSDELANSKCTSETCSLHFLQNSLTHSLKYPGITSKESAAGIIVANGVIDVHLKNDTSKTKQVPQTYVR